MVLFGREQSARKKGAASRWLSESNRRRLTSLESSENPEALLTCLGTAMRADTLLRVQCTPLQVRNGPSIGLIARI